MRQGLQAAIKALTYNCMKQSFLPDGMVVSGEQADAAAVDAVLMASRTLIGVATRSLGAAAEETTIAQYRTLVVLMSRGPQRMVDLAGALEVAPSTAGRMCDRLVRKGLIRRHRARADRRAGLGSITQAGRQVVDGATARRRAIIAGILAGLPPERQHTVAAAMAEFAAAAGEVPDSEWPSAQPAAIPATPTQANRAAATAGTGAERRA